MLMVAALNRAIGHELRQARKRAGLTIADLAARLDGTVKEQTLWRIESGQEEVTVRWFADTLTLLGVPPGVALIRAFLAANVETGLRMSLGTTPAPVKPVPNSSMLSYREAQILQLIARGLDNGQIALQLRISVETVKSTNKRLFKKLNVDNRTLAAQRAGELGLTESDSH